MKQATTKKQSKTKQTKQTCICLALSLTINHVNPVCPAGALPSHRISLQRSHQHLHSLQPVSPNGVAANHGVRPVPEAALHREGTVLTQHVIQTQQCGVALRLLCRL